MLTVAAKIAAAMTGLGTLTAAFGFASEPGARGILIATGTTFAVAGLLFLERPTDAATQAA